LSFTLSCFTAFCGSLLLAQSRVVRDGVAVEFSSRPLKGEHIPPDGLRQGEDAIFSFSITDATTRAPISGAQPVAWMELLADGRAADPDLCRNRVRSHFSGNIFSRTDLSFNAYYTLVMNQEATITVVDPLFSFGSTKLLALIPLRSPAEDWALTADQNRLFVSQPESHTVTAIDTLEWKAIRDLDVGGAPSRIALQPDNQYLWVALAGGVTAIETASLRVAARIPTSHGTHDLAFSSDSRFLFVTNRAAGNVSVIDVHKLLKKSDVATGPEPLSVAFSQLSQRAYIAHATGLVSSIDGATAAVIRSVKTDAGLSQIRFEQRGRWGFLVNPEKNLLYVLDAASGRVVQTAKMEGGPDQITFSDKLVYVRRRGSETVNMIPLADVGTEGQALAPADFPGGQHPLGMISRYTPADSIVQIPGEDAVLVANPADKSVYYYQEGMAAPRGQFSNYEREARAVLVVDRSLKATLPGTYQTTARLGNAGRYLVPFVLPSPSVVRCFEVDVKPNPELVASSKVSRTVRVAPEIGSLDFRIGSPVPIRFRLLDATNGRAVANIADVWVLVTQASGNGQWRLSASPEGPGYYAAFVTDMPGTYYVFVASSSHGLSFSNSGGTQLEVKEK
jgi:hypothetical protein